MSKRIGISKTNERALTKNFMTADGFNNFSAKLGLQADNLSSRGGYTLGNFLSRNHVALEAMYRSSWVVGQVVDTVAEDMTKEGVSMLSKMSPDDIQILQSKITELSIWKSLCSTIKWSRLYGGAIAVIMTEGADYEQPLDITRIGKNSFKGLVVFDRWQVDPSFGDLITELCPEIGMPKYYKVLSGMETMSDRRIHYSRCIRLDGIEMPYYQKKTDNLWGMSVIERMYDRLLAFDSSTQGAAQLMYKAYLRVVQIEGLRDALAVGGEVEQAVIKQFQYIRLMQNMEGITLLDSKDTFAAHHYTFAGISDVLIQFGQQISGATNIPLVRLFGQSPAGLSSTGESDLRNYYDNIKKDQENKLRLGVRKTFEVLSMSCFGKQLPDDFEFHFNSLWQLSETEKATIAANDSSTINNQVQSGTITKKIALKELKQSSLVTGRFTNITDEDIENAKEEPPEHNAAGGGGIEEKIEAKPDHKIDFEGLRKQLAGLKTKLSPAVETPDTPDSQLSIEQLEAELDALDPTSIESLERQLLQLNNNSITIEDLENDLRELGVSDPSIALLEKQLRGMSAYKVPKKMGFFDSIKKFFSRTKDADFKEEEHPRKAGQFVKKGTGESSSGKEKSPADEFKSRVDSLSSELDKAIKEKDVKKQKSITMKLKGLAAEAEEHLAGLNKRKTEIDKRLAEMKPKQEPSKPEAKVAFKGLALLDKNQVKLINDCKLSEVQIKGALSFPGYNVETRYDFKKNLPGVVRVVTSAIGKDETDIKSKTADAIQTTFSVDIDHPDEIHLDYLEVVGKKNNGIAKDYLKRMEDLAIKTGKSKMSLLADISIGRYAWAKTGFTATPEAVKKIKSHFLPYAKKVLALSDDADNYKANVAKMEVEISKLKTIEEIADYKFPGTEFSSDKLRMIKYKNDDVPSDLVMHLGKSYLTNNALSEMTDWVGTREVSKTGDSMFMKDESGEVEETKPKIMLLLTNKERGVEEGETDFEFHKDVLLGE